MPAARPIKTNFSAGEFSPRLIARVDLERYGNAAAEMTNVLVQPQGGATRRPGTYFVEGTRDAGARVRLVRFEVSTAAAYILEFGDGYIRFYNNRGQLMSGMSPVEVVSPYATAQLRELRFAQSADVLYITHKDHAPRKLSRTSTTTFALSAIDFQDGPYQPVNITDTTVSISPTWGVCTATASSSIFSAGNVGQILAIRDEVPARVDNGGYLAGQVFYADDRGVIRLYRVMVGGNAAGPNYAGTTPNYDLNMPTGEGDAVRDGSLVLSYLGRGKSAWGWGVITAVASGTSATVVANEKHSFPTNITAAREWRFGEWGGSRGYPRTVALWQGRTVWGGSIAKPQTLWFSETSDYEAFSPSEPDNAVLDTNAVTVTLDDGEVQTIRWMESTQRGIVLGTPSAIFTVGPANSQAAFSPVNVEARRREDTGSSDTIAGFREQGVVLFVENGGRKVREFTYDFASDSFAANDLTILAEHITAAGLVEAAFARRPDRLFWGVRSDGVLVTLTYDREQQVRAWTKHTLGGGGLAETVAVVPGPDGKTDDVYVVVNRSGQRTVEFIRPAFDATLEGERAGFFLDSGLTYSGTAATTFSGLSHLDGKTVRVLAGGADRGTAVVVGGTVTIEAPAATVAHIGYDMTARIVCLPWEAGAAGGTAQGRPQRLAEVSLRLHQTGGSQAGRTAGPMKDLFTRTPADLMDQGPPLFTGWRRFDSTVGWSRDDALAIESVPGQPLTVLAVVPEVVTSG